MKRRIRTSSSYLIILTMALLLPLGSTHGAAYMKLGDIKGESTDSAHEGEIDVLSWSWEMSRESSISGGGGAGKANFQDISVTKELDKSSPLLMHACASGEPIPNATITMFKAGDKPFEYIRITMRDIMVTSVSTGGSSGDDRFTENVTLSFGYIQIEYTPQKEDGTPDEKTQFSWDLAAGTPG